MLVIVCPNCGPRNNSEFSFQGEITPRPSPETDESTWRSYLYMKKNASGWQTERWFHVSGCRRFLNVERHTGTNEIGAVTPVRRTT